MLVVKTPLTFAMARVNIVSKHNTDHFGDILC